MTFGPLRTARSLSGPPVMMAVTEYYATGAGVMTVFRASQQMRPIHAATRRLPRYFL